MNLCVTVEGSPRVNALPSSSSSTWPEMSNKSNPVSLLPHLVHHLKMHHKAAAKQHLHSADIHENVHENCSGKLYHKQVW